MTEPELIAGAAAALQDAIYPLITPTRFADSLYSRMRDALTATSAQSGAPMQASKAPARIDVICWFVDIDGSVAAWADGTTTTDKLTQIADTKWTPDHLKLVKAMTSRCEHWASSARHILGDNPPRVPVQRRPCPICNELWVKDRDQVRSYALTATIRNAAHGDDWMVTCANCKTAWITKAEQAVLLKLIGVA
jgi:hypothetical protein